MVNIEKLYALSPDPIFWTIQGEAHLRGFQMLFLRLAGCSVGCAECDTDYSVDSRDTAASIAARCNQSVPNGMKDKWVWITGGEPTDHNLRPLFRELRSHRFSIALASAGHKRVIDPVDWLSISPHRPSQWIQRYGNELKLVHGMNGFGIEDFIKEAPEKDTDFMYRYVQPLSVNGAEDHSSLQECLSFLKHNPNWSLSRQDHVYWNVK